MDDTPASVRELQDPTAPPRAWTTWRLTPGVQSHSKFTPEIQERVIGAIARTGSLEVAARAAGITSRCLRKWHVRGREELESIEAALHEGRQPDPAPFAEFYLECQRALGWSQASLISIIHQRAAEDWRAAAWLLERLGGKLASERVEVEHSGEVTTKDVADQMRERFEQIRERAAAVHGEDR